MTKTINGIKLFLYTNTDKENVLDQYNKYVLKNPEKVVAFGRETDKTIYKHGSIFIEKQNNTLCVQIG